MTRLMNRRPSREGRVFLAALPFALVILRAHGVRHRRHHGGARARRARLRVRDAGTSSRSCACSRRRVRMARRRSRPRAPEIDGAHLVNSGPFSGKPQEEGFAEIVAWLEREGKGKGVAQYRLHDWCISRQRYWGPPIPIIYCKACGPVAVPEKDLPVLLPDLEDFRPDDSGVSPLARNQEWYNVPCPQCGGPGASRDRRVGHVPRLVVVPPALPLDRVRRPAVRPGAGEEMAPGGDVHRGQRTRGAASPVCALRVHGPLRPGLPPFRRAVPEVPGPRH